VLPLAEDTDNIYKKRIRSRMTTFIFTQALNVLNNQKTSFLNTINSTPFGDVVGLVDQKTSWKKDKISGKLSELSIQTSTYNKTIPKVYGTNKVAGNIVWLDEAQEVVNNNTTTIKLSKGQKIKQNVIEYFYFLSFAVVICGNEINDIKNVWANSTLLNLEDYTYRFYNGTEDQEQDPLIKSKDVNCTAYRGCAYIVFENFPLSQFNNTLPNMMFEVTRRENREDGNVKNLIDGIKLFPLCGNYGHSAEIQQKGKYPYVYDYFMNGGGEYDLLNKHNSSNYADSVLSLQQLREVLPNSNYYCISSTFFANCRNIANCILAPRAEFSVFVDASDYHNGLPILTRPDTWNVGDKTRFTTELLGKEDEKFRYYGGTPSDNSMLSIFNYVKSLGGHTIFCPNIYVDADERGEGKDLYGTAEDMVNFFTKTNGYNDFILHYANLLKDLADVFIIGNELKELTKLKDENNNFIVVNQLKILAQAVRDIVGDGVKITYSAGYKEYHNYDGWYNLDELWSDNNIDFVGIKAYFPLTFTTQDQITSDLIKNGWESGEGYDYITMEGIRENIAEKSAYKNIKYWWNNYHTNPDLSQTDWIPQSKKIWFTEFGFCSTDATTNEPYKEYKGNNSEAIPVFSNENVDISAQKLAIEATIEYWSDKTDMVEKKILNYWDMRPYPYFPNKTSIWPDGEEWKHNYCVNNKLNIGVAKDFINQIFADANLSRDIINKTNVDEFVDGLILNNNMTVRDALYILQKFCFFDCVEKYDKIELISNKSSSRNNQTKVDIYHNDIIGKNNGENNTFIETKLIGANNLVKKLSLLFLDKNCDYDCNLVNGVRENAECVGEMIDTIPVVLDEKRARSLCETILNNLWTERLVFKFSVGLKYIFLDVPDLINLHTKNNVFLLKINYINVEHDKINIIAVQYNANISDVDYDIVLNDTQPIEDFIQNSELSIVELPSINNLMLNSICLFFVIKQNSKYWGGANIYYSDSFGREYRVAQTAYRPNIVGDVVFINNSNPRPYYLDKRNYFDVFFSDVTPNDFMRNLNTFELLNGENLILLGNEILQYKTITLNTNGSYRIKDLMRGLFGTENRMYDHTVGERFIFLEDLSYQEFSYDKKEENPLYKIVNFNGDISDATTINYKIIGKNLSPLRPCHVRRKNNAITWERVDRGNTRWFNDFENFCVENEEKYCLEFYLNNLLVKKTYINNKRSHELDEELLTGNFSIKLYQVGRYGNGETLVVQF
jgi:hypothetical protein